MVSAMCRLTGLSVLYMALASWAPHGFANASTLGKWDVGWKTVSPHLFHRVEYTALSAEGPISFPTLLTVKQDVSSKMDSPRCCWTELRIWHLLHRPCVGFSNQSNWKVILVERWFPHNVISQSRVYSTFGVGPSLVSNNCNLVKLDVKWRI